MRPQPLCIAAALLAVCSGQVYAQTCFDFAPTIVPFQTTYYISSPNGAGDRLLVGVMDITAVNNFPIQNQPNQKFCGLLELAPGFFAEAYVPTVFERQGRFSEFAGLLYDPVTLIPFPGGIISANRLGDPNAWRISSTTASFSGLTQSGVITFTRSDIGPAPPEGFQLGDPPTYFDISTTASFSGPATICIQYSGINFIDEMNVGLFHYEGTSWVDRTLSHDPTIDEICASVDSLSPFAIFEASARVGIDIKPSTFPNSINRTKKGVVPVALFSSTIFDATAVDQSTIIFGGASPSRKESTPKDVNGDGLLDVVFHFDAQKLNLPDGTLEACLTGATTSGLSFKGCDSVRLVQ